MSQQHSNDEVLSLLEQLSEVSSKDSFKGQSTTWLLYSFERVNSTMDIARLISRNRDTCSSFGVSPREFTFRAIKNCKAVAPIVIVSREQSAGRGRHGRAWVSLQKLGIYVTYLICPNVSAQQLSGFSLVIGLAVARTIYGFGIKCGLKWPNDIVYPIENKHCLEKGSYFSVGSKNYGKVGGVLVECGVSSDSVLSLSVGVGVNLFSNKDIEAFGGIALEDVSSRKYKRDYRELSYSSFLAELTRNLVELSGEYLSSGFEPFVEEWNKFSILIGHQIRVRVDGRSQIVIVRGVNNKGGLIVSSVESPNSNSILYSGEVESVDVAGN